MVAAWDRWQAEIGAAKEAVDLPALNAAHGDVDREDGGDAEPALGTLEGHDSQVTWLRGTTRDLELTSAEEW
ncbi:hypothetical protein FV232_27260 [Methylobacterium sp. WL30]|nr:hypothetical protein FV225_20835 [Methylobacterium sp. WL93]TXN50030.1 hypothetical protein FV227_14180 [Methylobacterium sp. WL119]TXN61336.1 hypothetical protein FV232_27260 [Methylobacterium sp. WL30]